MRLLPILLSLSVIAQLAHGDLPPKIELPPNETLEILHPTVVQNDSTVAVSGRVKRLIPWADTAWDHIEISLFDQNGSLIIQIATDYSPRPIPPPYHSTYEPSSRFAVRIKGITRRVYSVHIACFPGSVSHLKSGEVE